MKTREIISELEKQPSHITLVAAQRLRELTELRPMESAIAGEDALYFRWRDCVEVGMKWGDKIIIGYDYEDDGRPITHELGCYMGWLPLPEGGE